MKQAPFIIPEAAIEQHIAVLGKSGSGKTFITKAAIVEPLLERGRRVAIVDPTSAWWGLRSSRAGTEPGFKILVLGGDHGDLPLTQHSGGPVARLIVEQRINVICDTGNMTVGEMTRWAIDFFGTLYRLNRDPLHLVVDEIHNFAPQGRVPDPEAGRMLHAVNKIASGGRSRGIRLHMLTQRPQKLHKDTLTTADTLIAMRCLAPQDRHAVKDWIEGCGDLDTGRQILNSLASLQRGEGWVWYPEGSFLERMKFPEIRTFDSSATPGAGDSVASPKAVSTMDMTAISAALAEAQQQAKENDPALLRKRIAELESAKGGGADPQLIAAAERRGREAGRLEMAELMTKGRRTITDAVATLHNALDELNSADLPPVRAVTPSAPARQTTPPAGRQDTGSVGGGLRRMMIALAQRTPHGLTRRQLGVRSGMSSKSGTFATYLANARSAGWISDANGAIHLTDKGRAALGTFEALPTGRALLEYWTRELGESGATRVLRVLAEVYPNELPRDQVATRADMSAASGTFATYLSKLRSLELVTGSSSGLRASEELFA